MSQRVAGDGGVCRTGLIAAAPVAGALDVEEERKLLEQGEDCSQRPLGGGDVVSAVRVADGNVRADGSGNPFGARKHAEHQAHAAQVRPGAHGAGGIGIGDPDIDFDVTIHLVGDGNQLDSLGEFAQQLGQ